MIQILHKLLCTSFEFYSEIKVFVLDILHKFTAVLSTAAT